MTERKWDLGAALLFLGLTFLWCGPILTDPAHVAADVGDPLHMAWAMAWVAHQLPRDPLALFDSNNFFPYENSLAFGDHLLPEALIAWPIQLLTGNAILALNLVTAFGLFSSALAAYFLVSRLLGSGPAGLIAGTALAFNAFMQGELLRVNVLQLQGWCLSLFFLWRFSEAPTWRHSVAFSLALALQGLSGTYYAVYSAILVPGFVASVYLCRKRLPKVPEAVRLMLPALFIGVAGFLFLSPYRHIALRALAQKPIADGADLASFLLPGRDFWLLGGTLASAPKGESNHFLGYIALSLAALALFTRRGESSQLGPARQFLALSAGVLILVGGVIAAGAHPRFMGESLGESPYLGVLRAFPILQGMATVERASVLVHIGVALLAGIGAFRLFSGRKGFALASAFIVALLSAAEQWTKPGPGFRVPAGSELPEVYRYLATETGPVVELPLYPDRLMRFRALYPYFSTYHWRRVPIGRASFYPPAHDYLATLLQGFPDPVSIEALREAGIRDLVVHPKMWQTGRGARLRALEGPDFELLRSFPDEVSGAARSLDLGGERVYRLRPGLVKERVCTPRKEVDRSRLTIRSTASEGVERIRDGDLGTAWSTVRPQAEGDSIEFDWNEVRPLMAIRLSLGSRVSDFPTALRVDTAIVPGEWQEVEVLQTTESATGTLRELLRSDPTAGITIGLPLTKARSVRLRTGRDESRPGWNPWSIAEIHFFSECLVTEKP